jgi:hypothetical protein
MHTPNRPPYPVPMMKTALAIAAIVEVIRTDASQVVNVRWSSPPELTRTRLMFSWLGRVLPGQKTAQSPPARTRGLFSGSTPRNDEQFS